MSQESKKLSAGLLVEKLNHTLAETKKTLQQFKDLADTDKELREDIINQLNQFALSVTTSKLDQDYLKAFFDYPYCIIPGKNEREFFLIMPKFIDAHFGWLHKQTPSFNIFLVNPYVDWLGELPDALKKELKIPDPLDVYLDGDYLVGSDTGKIESKFKPFIRRKEKDGRLLIDKSRHFELLAKLIKDGILPFVPKPIDPADLVNRKCDFELRDYQLEAWKTLKKYSNIGVFFPPSTGKTWFGMYACTHLKGPHLVTAPSTVLIEQWVERFQTYTDLNIGSWHNSGTKTKVFKLLEAGEIDVMITTYQSAINHCADFSWSGLLVDEVHHMPANLFSKMATFKRKYMIGLSATPQREDDREEYIFALTGKPVGLSWENFKKLGIITNPPLHCWIVKSEAKRFEKLNELLQEEKKTIIFCDSIEMGKIVSKRFDIPHVYSATKEKLSVIQDSITSVVSRVGDEGISIPDIERVIEISWLHGSRRQELQRFTRLLHGKNTQGVGHIIMTAPEYVADRKRLFGIMDKGFTIKLHREGISDKVISSWTQKTSIAKPIKIAKKAVVQTTPKEKIEQSNFELNHPILSLPGVQKKLALLNKGERTLVNLLFQREGEEFTGDGLAMLLGYANYDSLRATVSMKKIQNLGLIIRPKPAIFKAELKLMGLKKNAS